MNGIGLQLSPVISFGISGAGPLDSTAGELVNQSVDCLVSLSGWWFVNNSSFLDV